MKLGGYVYFIGSTENKIVKIGATKGESIKKRIDSIKTSCPFDIEVFGYLNCVDIDCYLVEKDLHRLFTIYRKNGEWFDLRGFLAAFLIDKFSESEQVNIYTLNGNARYIWTPTPNYIPENYIRTAVKEYNSKSKYQGVLAGMESMIAELMKRNAELESRIQAVYRLSKKQCEAIEEISECNHKDKSRLSGVTEELIRRNYASEYKLDAAHYLAMQEDWEDFFGNGGSVACDTPEEYLDRHT